MTIPPCSETVSFFVLTSGVKTMSQAQLEAFQGILPANNRPVQSMNGRATFKNTFPGCHSLYSSLAFWLFLDAATRGFLRRKHLKLLVDL